MTQMVTNAFRALQLKQRIMQEENRAGQYQAQYNKIHQVRTVGVPDSQNSGACRLAITPQTHCRWDVLRLLVEKMLRR